MTGNSPETGQQPGTTTTVGHRQCAGRWGEMLLNKKPSVLVVCALGLGWRIRWGQLGKQDALWGRQCGAPLAVERGLWFGCWVRVTQSDTVGDEVTRWELVRERPGGCRYRRERVVTAPGRWYPERIDARTR